MLTLGWCRGSQADQALVLPTLKLGMGVPSLHQEETVAHSRRPKRLPRGLPVAMGRDDLAHRTDRNHPPPPDTRASTCHPPSAADSSPRRPASVL